MADAVVHFEVTGPDPGALQRFYSAMFGWEFEAPSTVAAEVSAPGEYRFLDLVQGPNGSGIRGGIAGGPGFAPAAVFYVGVDDVRAAVARAEGLGGTCILGPVTSPQGLVVAHVRDPQGAVVGLAGG